MILIFVFGYLCIALEHKLRIDKAAIALLMCGALWTVLSLLGNDAQIGTQLIEQLGDTSEILFFLIGAMTIVELIDRHGGFHVITDHIKTRNKRKLLWLLSIITFFMSAVLDNMTTTIIMIMLLRRMISGQKERWIFASVIVIAANSGGAFSPIGDVTTIMLWMRGNVTSGLLVAKLFLPALVSVIIPTAIACRYIPDENAHPEKLDTRSFCARMTSSFSPCLSTRATRASATASISSPPIFLLMLQRAARCAARQPSRSACSTTALPSWQRNMTPCSM